MNHSLHQIPFFQELEESENILLAGTGGGFDIYSGIPLYFSLVAQGKNVIVANLSFTDLPNTTSECVFPHCYEVKGGDQVRSGRSYFPEKYLKLWMAMQGQNIPIYAFERTGVKPLRDAYKYLIKEHAIDTVVLVDGGTDSLMFGDEESLGTPEEDIASMAAVFRSGIKKQFLVSVGFGIDHFHGVSHYRFLENLAEISREGGYLGLFQVIEGMPEAAYFLDAVRFANDKMAGMESIVANSVASALEGNFGDVHRTRRTAGSTLWINPLMTIHWCFELRSLVKKVKYYDWVKDSNTMAELHGRLMEYRRGLESRRLKKGIPI